MLKPEQVFDAKQKALAVVRGRLEHVPEELRKAATAAADEALKGMPPGVPGLYAKMMRDAASFGAMLLNDGRELTLTLDLNRGTNELRSTLP